MLVVTKDGRQRSERTVEEKRVELYRRMASLDKFEHAMLLRFLDDHDALVDESALGFDSVEEILQVARYSNHVTSKHYREHLVSMKEFVYDDFFLGTTVGTYLFPRWFEDLVSIFDGHYTEAVITGSLGSGKCLSGDTEFYDPAAGIRKTLVDSSKGDGRVHVASYNKDKGCAQTRKAMVKKSGVKRLGTLTLQSGRKLRLSPDHPILAPFGYEQTGSLEPGALVATIRKYPEPDASYDVSDELVEFVAFMLTDGSCSSGNWAFSNESLPCISRFWEVSASLWVKTQKKSTPGLTQKEKREGKCRQFYPRGTKWIQRMFDLYGTAYDKRVPGEFLSLDDRQLGLFLNRIWACDGWLSKNEIGISLSSEMFIRDIQDLLLRFEVHSRIKRERKSYVYKGKKKWRWSWRLSVNGKGNIERFLEATGLILGKEEAAKSLLSSFDGKTSNPNVDVVPLDYALSIRLRKELGEKAKGWKGASLGQQMGHGTFVKLRDKYRLPEWCAWWGDVFWDRVESYVVDDEMEDVFDVEVPGTKNFAPSGIVVHNTTFCDIALIRMFYEIYMLKNPQATFNLMPNTEIVLVCFNRDDTLAREVTYGGVKAHMENSPFFNNIGCKFGTSVTVLPSTNLKVMAVSARSAKALGRNVFGGIIDETDFLEGSSFSGKDKAIGPHEKPFAEQLYASIVRRMKSRYEKSGFMPGKLLLSSSAKNKGSFTNKRMSEAAGEPGVFVRDYAIYDVKPADQFSAKRFWVMAGNERIRHRILTDNEYEEIGDQGRIVAENDGCRFLHVPDNFRTDFERNIEDSIRDICGVVTTVSAPYIQMRDKIYEAIDPTLQHPARDEVWVTNKPPPIRWDLLCHEVTEKVGAHKEIVIKPIRHPDALRNVHVDLSLGKTDAAGICIGHIAEMIDVERRSEDGHIYYEEAPLIEVDLMLRVEAPPNGEVDIGAIRGLIYHFVDRGFQFGFASMDAFQSGESLQKLRWQGVPADKVSIDKTTEPYDFLKLALYEGRISMYRYPWVIRELEGLQRNYVRNRVDHPSGAGGSKDVSDSLAGVVYSLSTKIKFRSPLMLGDSDYDDSSGEKDDEWIRATMHRKGDRPVEPVGGMSPSGGPLIVTG